VNNTHNNLVDESIDIILCYKYVEFYLLKKIIYNILSFGLIGLLCILSDKIFLYMFCKPCIINEVQLFKLLDVENRAFIIIAQRQNFYKKYHFLKTKALNEDIQKLNIDRKFSRKDSIINKNDNLKSNLENSNYIGDDYLNNDEECIVFYFKNNKYIYSEMKNSFVPVLFNLSEYSNNDIHNNFSNGINNLLEYNYLLNKFEENLMKLKDKTFFKIILKRILRPASLYQVSTILFWMFIHIYYLYPVIIIFYTLLLFVTSYQKYMNYKKIFNEDDFQDPYKILSVNINIKIKNKEFQNIKYLLKILYLVL